MAISNTNVDIIKLCTRQATIIMICSVFFLTSNPAVGEPVTGREYAVKLGFIYNFVRFTTWPETAFEKNSDPLTLYIVTDNSHSGALYKLDGKNLKDRKIKVMTYEQGTSLNKGHILFFDTQDKAFIRQVLDQTFGLNILTIGEFDDFTRIGGIINLFSKGEKMGFRINIKEAERNHLKLSSQLLRSADEIVRGIYKNGAFVKEEK